MPFKAAARKLGTILYSITLLLCIPCSAAEKNITFSAAEQEPYIGLTLPNNGYVHELVVTAYKRAGYNAIIKFYPAARARRLLDAGKVDGIVPANPNENFIDKIIYSSPFPGGELGLLKRKTLTLPNYPPNISTAQLLINLNNKRVGIVRDAMTISEVSEADSLYIEAVNSDLQNIDKLVHNRLDLIVIDKYNAADLMVRNRPHAIGKLNFIESTLTATTFHIGFNNNTNPALIARLKNRYRTT